MDERSFVPPIAYVVYPELKQMDDYLARQAHRQPTTNPNPVDEGRENLTGLSISFKEIIAKLNLKNQARHMASKDDSTVKWQS
jgi:hypothetical protein